MVSFYIEQCLSTLLVPYLRTRLLSVGSWVRVPGQIELLGYFINNYLNIDRNSEVSEDRVCLCVRVQLCTVRSPAPKASMYSDWPPFEIRSGGLYLWNSVITCDLLLYTPCLNVEEKEKKCGDKRQVIYIASFKNCVVYKQINSLHYLETSVSFHDSSFFIKACYTESQFYF